MFFFSEISTFLLGISAGIAWIFVGLDIFFGFMIIFFLLFFVFNALWDMKPKKKKKEES